MYDEQYVEYAYWYLSAKGLNVNPVVPPQIKSLIPEN